MAQAPVVSNIDVNNATVNRNLIITGSGFSNNPADLRVFFGGVAGNIISSSGSSIEVGVPAGTTTRSLQVVNRNTGLSGWSRPLFYLSFSGSTFDPAKMDPEIQFTNANEYFDLCLCDFSGDGKNDVAVTQVEPGSVVIVYQNTSTIDNISFNKLNGTTNPELNINSASSNVTCGDVDADGRTDMIVSKGGAPRNAVYVFRNISSGGNIKFANPLILFLDTEDIAKRLQVRDIDLDGKPEIIVTNTFLPNIKIFRNTSSPGNVSFDASPININIPGAGTTNGLVVDDLNGDRLPDLAVNPFIGSNLYFLVNQSGIGNISFRAPQTYTITGNLNNLVAGDFNNDGKTDIAGTRTIQDQVFILVNNTAANSSTIVMQNLTLSGDEGPWGINAADMDGDGKLDILTGNRDTNTVTVFRNTSSGNTMSFVKHSLNTVLNTRNIAGGDVDGDGKPDLAFTSFDINTSQFSLSMMRNSHCFIPVVEPAGPLTLCTGETKRLRANSAIGATYQWDRNNVVVKTGPEDFLDIISPGVYKVVVTTESGNCIFASNAVIVQSGTGTVPADPVIYNTGPFCEGEDIILTTDELAGAVYSWEGPSGFTASTQGITIPDADANRAGSYSLVVSVLDCSSNAASTVVDVVTLPAFNITTAGTPDACEGGSVQMNVGNLAGYTYQWFRDAQPVTGATGVSYNAPSEGSYNVEVIQTSTSCKTMSSNQIDVDIFSTPVPIFSSPPNGCLDIAVAFTNSSVWDPAGVPEFSWNFGDGSPADTLRNPSHTYTSEGNFSVTLTVDYTTANCPASVTRDISIQPELSFEIVRSILDQEKLCIGQEVSLTTIPEFESYSWNTGENTAEIDITSTGDYSVTVTDEFGCTGTQTEFVEFFPLPEIIASASAEEVFPEEEFQLEAQGALNYFWTPVDVLDDPTSATPNASIVRSTEFIVTGEDANQCSSSDTVLVTVKGENAILVNPRKVFSPNGDGIDDFWLIENIERYPDASIMIFTAEGSTVYEASPYNNDWNGVYNGKNLPEGAYFYVIRVKEKDPKTGSITLIR